MLDLDTSRRQFLKTSGALIVTFTLAARGAQAQVPPWLQRSTAPDEVGSYIVIDANGMVTLYTGKVELGTGVITALTQILAEELSVPFASVTTVQGDTNLTPNQEPTWGSYTIQHGGMQIRRAAATAREKLLDLAAERLNAAKADLAIRDGVVSSRAGDAKISYAQLLDNQDFSIKIDPTAPLKNPQDYTIVGTSVPRLDIPPKIFGKFFYVQDLKLPGMLQARMLHPKAIGAKLLEFNDAACRQIPGYVGAVRKENFLAVVATDEWSAIRASDAISVTWSAWDGLPDESRIFEYVRNAKVERSVVLDSVGDTVEALKGRGTTLQATYEFAMHTHGSIGPSCAVADFRDGRLTVWSPAQDCTILRELLAIMLQLTPDRVRCIYMEGAGCYGRNGADDCSSEAALIAKELGRPVRLQWSRADENGWDPKGPPALLDYRALLDDDRRIAAWESDIYFPERPMNRSGVTLLAAALGGLPAGSSKNVEFPVLLGIPYALPNKLTAHLQPQLPIREGWIRAPGRIQATWGNESFIDELADAARVDPFEIRMRNLTDQRGLELLERLRQFAKWEPRGSRSRDSGPLARGRGLSYVKYELVRTYIGIVADVTVDRTTGQIHVDRVWVVHDCGQIINPDGLRNQIEGNVVQSLSRTLIEKVTFNRSAVTSLDWVTYPILTFPGVPEIAIDLIDRPNDVPWGAGEPTTSVIPAAVGNAVFDATGARLRSVPFRPATVLAALSSGSAK